MMMKSFVIQPPGFSEWAYYCGDTAPKARYAAYIDLKNAGYNVSLIDIKVRRSDHDDIAAKQKTAKSIGFEVMQKIRRIVHERTGI